jgi:hypothetical protein
MMRKASLVLIQPPFFDYLGAFKHALLEANIESEIVTIPYSGVGLYDLAPDQLKDIKNVIKTRQDAGRFVIFFPGAPELFLEDPDWSFACSHYRNWYGKKVAVIPHVWTHVGTPTSIAPLKWTDKPAFRIGFMGSAYSNSRVGKAASKLPVSVKKWLLRGRYLKRAGALARMNQLGLSLKFVNTFPRSETLKKLTTENAVVEKGSVEIVDTQGFTGSEHDKTRYIRHLEAMTYVICPRGIENFSIRVYEALKYGRIPVIIDTEMVLPTEIDWDQVAIRIPYDCLNNVYDIILNDYNSRSADEFIARQQTAFSTMHELDSMQWLTSHLRDILTGG